MSGFNKKILGIVLCVLPILVSVVAFFVVRQPSINLLDSNECLVSSFRDSMSGGNSESIVTRENGVIRLDFKLDKDFDFPFAGIGFQKKDGTFFDIDGYILNIKMLGQDNLRMSIRMQKGIHTNEYGDLSVALVKSFTISPSSSNIVININDVNVIPDWWFAQNPQVNRDIEINDFDDIHCFWILAECSTPRDKVFSFTFESATLDYDYTNFIYGLLVFFIAYILFCSLAVFIWKKINGKAQKEYVYMRVEKTDIVNVSEDLRQRLIDYIGHNYHNPEIKLGDAAAELGITEDKALELLKGAVGMNFRSYLNCLRIEEAKRLLLNSEYQISEIAFKVGYNNVQHFNRVFKEITGETPRGFREK